jgi:hypothetical protein
VEVTIRAYQPRDAAYPTVPAQGLYGRPTAALVIRGLAIHNYQMAKTLDEWHHI